MLKNQSYSKELAIFKAARKLKDKLGDDVIRQTIISHATSVSDMLELAILLKEVGLVDKEKSSCPNRFLSLKQLRTWTTQKNHERISFTSSCQEMDCFT